MRGCGGVTNEGAQAIMKLTGLEVSNRHHHCNASLSWNRLFCLPNAILQKSSFIPCVSAWKMHSVFVSAAAYASTVAPGCTCMHLFAPVWQAVATPAIP